MTDLCSAQIIFSFYMLFILRLSTALCFTAAAQIKTKQKI